MNTFFEGDVDIGWFRDYCQLSEHVKSAWISLSKRVFFDKKNYKISDLYYSEFQGEVILFLENLEQKNIVFYFELMTKSKINHFMKITQTINKV